MENKVTMKTINNTVNNIANIDHALMLKAQKRLDNLTKPVNSLGRLEELAKLIVGISGKEDPEIKNKVIFTFASDHGVAAEKVSAFPQEVTTQMVYNFLNEGAAINVLAKHAGARVVIADLGVASILRPHPRLIERKINMGTKNMAEGPAMTRAEAIRSIETGIDIFERELKLGIDICATGEMGIANTTASSALAAVFLKKKAEEITGKGTGICDDSLKSKISVIKKAIEINLPDAGDPIDTLSKVGGFEIGALAGIILAAASHRIPVVLDGFISGAAALIAYNIEPKTKNYMIPSHCSVETGHKHILKYLGLKPLFDLSLRLGEGTGAAIGITLVEAAVKILTQMATFENAGVSQKNEQ